MSAPPWPPGSLTDPAGRPLVADTPHSLAGGGERWPVVDGIPYLRAGRDTPRAAALAALDAGDREAALVALLPDQDDWSTLTPPGPDAVRAALAATTLRAAMEHLGYGPVGDYFAHRPSDPTYLSGLALIDAHRPAPRSALELGCGIGWLLRPLAQRGAAVTGIDVVFSKLWLARRFVVPAARLACMDAASPLPRVRAELALCHDALHYLPDPDRAVAELHRIAGPDGTVLVGHAHNALVENLSPGAPRRPDEWAALFAAPVLYDDRELAGALLDGRAPRPEPAEALADREAVALASSPPRPAGAGAPLGLPPRGASLRLNPLLRLDGGTGRPRVRWPSDRYATEYAELEPQLTRDVTLTPELVARAAAAGGDDPELLALARRRVFVELPDAW